MLLRLSAYLFLCVALVAAAFDGTRMIADKDDLAFTSFLTHWQLLDPHSLDAARGAVEQMNPYLWNPLLMTVLVLPTWAVAAGLGLLLYIAGYRRPRPALPDGI
jgi:hypothetical protein